MNSKEIIKSLNLSVHPEGGYYKENYRSEGLINVNNLWEGAEGDRNYSTGIYFLLEKKQFSEHFIKLSKTKCGIIIWVLPYFYIR